MKKYAAAALLVVGLLQMAGDVFHLPALRGIGAATTASPAPRVFSSVRGLETYSTHFFIEWTDRDGRAHSLRLTPELYAQLRGPYNRRNVYGAVLAYGPVLQADPRTRPLFEAVARYALCDDAPLLRELGIDPDQIQPGSVRVRLHPLPGTDIGDLNPVLEVSCP
jgi:hypothetical protein